MASGVGAADNWKTRRLADLEIPIIRWRCQVCSTPIQEVFYTSSGKCYECSRNPSYRFWDGTLDAAWCASIYLKDDAEFVTTRLIRDAKENPILTALMMDLAASEFLEDNPWEAEHWQPDVLVACPSSPRRGNARSQAMVRALSGALKVQGQDLLVRTDGGPARSQRTSKQLPRSTKSLLSEMNIKVLGGFRGEKVLLVDDLLTQGVTAAVSAYYLRKAGASAVRLCAMARFVSLEHLEGYCD
jgi:predicted amidophosphoribosyltransferase